MVKYNLIGKRFLRKYTAEESTPAYMSTVAAQTLVDKFCNVPWEPSDVRDATCTRHTNAHDEEGVKGLDVNVLERERFDAALFCADHVGGQHRAYANAAVYRYVLPDGTLPSLTKLTAKVTGDAYNAVGARIVLLTNSTGVIPTDCATVRGDVAGGIKATGVAPRETREISGKGYWYPKMESAVFSADPAEGEVALPTGGLQLQKYLFVFVLLENYNTVRGNWLEGSSYLTNLIELTTDAAVPGWTDGDTIDLTVLETAHTFKVVSGGVLPDNVSEVSGVRTIQLLKNGNEIFRKTRTIPPRDSGLFSNVVGKLRKMMDIDPETVTCVVPFNVSTNVNSTVVIKQYIAIGGTFKGGTFAEIDGLYLYSLDASMLIEGVTLGSGVPAWMKGFAEQHGGFAVVSANLDTNSQTAATMNSFTCVMMDGAALSAAGLDAGLMPAFLFGLSDTADPASFVAATTQQKDKYINIFPPVVKNVFVAAGLPMSSVIVSAYPFYGYSRGSETSQTSPAYGHCVRHAVLLGVMADGELKLVIPYYSSIQSARSPYTMVTHCDCNVISPSVSGKMTSVYPLTRTSDLPDTYPKYFDALVAVAGDLDVGGVNTSVALVTLRCTVEPNTLSDGSDVMLTGPTVPAWAETVKPDVYDRFEIKSTIPFEISLNLLPNNSTAIVSGAFSELGSVPHDRAAILDITNGTLVSTNGVFGGVNFIRSVANGETVYFTDAGSAGGESVYYEAGDDTATEEQSVIGLRRLTLAYALGGGDGVETRLAGIARKGAGYNVRSATAHVVSVDGQGNMASRTVNVWRLTSSVMMLSFAIPTTFRATKLRLDWPSIDATVGSRFNVWLKPGKVDDFPYLTDMRLHDGSANEVDGWRLVGVIDAATSTRTATFEVEPIVGYGATILLTAYVPLDDVNPTDQTIWPMGAATDMDVDLTVGTVSGLDTGWKPDITLIG